VIINILKPNERIDMALMFSTVLREADIPLAEVKLLRHKDQRAAKGRSPYELWRDDRPQFEWYQSTQSFGNRSKLKAPYWVVFLGTPSDETLFVGIYCVKYKGLLEEDAVMPHTGDVEKAGTADVYELTLDERLSDLIGKLYIDWGPGMRSWIQRADTKDKVIIELRDEFSEPEFPGYLEFIEPLSQIAKIPLGWTTVLQASRGVYLLTCPRTREQYVGSATGEGGFWNRWQDYIHTGHGGNVALKSREPSDYQVTILEVAGTAATEDDIIAMETRWKRKLQSREMGLNRN